MRDAEIRECVLKMEKEHKPRNSNQLGAEKDKAMNFPLEASIITSPVDNLTLVWCVWFQTYDPPNYKIMNLCRFLPISLW